MFIRRPSVEPAPEHIHLMPELPLAVRLPDGKEYSVGGDLWVLPEGGGLSSTVKIRWTSLISEVASDDSTPVLSERAVGLAKLYILEKLCSPGGAFKPQSADTILHSLLHFTRWLAAHPCWLPRGRSFDWSDLTAEMFDAWLTDEYRTKRKGRSATRVRRFYVWGADPDSGHPDFSADLALELSSLRIKGPTKGALVESRDSKQGAFSREELELIFKACARGAGTDRDRAIVLTLLETAIRPKQMALLTNRDLEIDSVPRQGRFGEGSNASTCRLRVRRLKRQGDTVLYHSLPISKGCVQLLLSTRRQGSGPDDRLFWWLWSDYQKYIDVRLKTFAKDANIRTPRLPVQQPEPGGPFHKILNISARRFRSGVATDRIDRGESPENVSEMLGHGDTDTLRSYVETSPRIADDFRRATDYAIKPLIDLMEGRCPPPSHELLLNDVQVLSSSSSLNIDTDIFVGGAADCYYNRFQGGNVYAGASIRRTASSQKSDTKIKELIIRARRKFPQIYPGQDFSAQVWDVAHLKARPNGHGVTHLPFTTRASTASNRNHHSSRVEDALPSCFADVIKSWVVIDSNVSLSTHDVRLYSGRYLWEFLLSRYGASIDVSIWGELSEDVILAFEQYLKTCKSKRGAPLGPNTIDLILRSIQRLTDFLASLGICRRIDYVPQTRPERRANAPLLEREREAEKILPRPGVLETLSIIYYRLTTAPAGEVNDWILILISAIVILMLTGLRIGELVTLPFDCEVTDRCPGGEGDEREEWRYGIRYWVEKTGGKRLCIKWISPTAESVVRASVARIKSLTAAARARARVLEADPTRVILPADIAGQTVIPRSELLALLGCKKDSHNCTLIPKHERGGECYSYVVDVEAYLLSKRVPQLYTVRHDDGTYQILSESLFIIFAKQTRYLQTSPCTLLVEPVSAQTILHRLSSPTNLFRRYGYEEWQKNLSVTPHSFRHWLINVAYKGGMETHKLLLYFAKRYAPSLADYLHFSTDEEVPYAPEDLDAEQFYVPV